MLKEKANICCLKLNQECEHSKATQISDYNFENKAIILASESAENAILNFIVPLRSHILDENSLHPVVFLLENE